MASLKPSLMFKLKKQMTMVILGFLVGTANAGPVSNKNLAPIVQKTNTDIKSTVEVTGSTMLVRISKVHKDGQKDA